MWQGVTVAVLVGLAAIYVGRRLLGSLRAKGPAPSCGCGCGGAGPCHQIEPLPGPAPSGCDGCKEGPPPSS